MSRRKRLDVDVDNAIAMAIVCGATPAKAAAAAGVTEDLVRDRLKVSRVRRHIERLRRDNLRRTARALNAAAAEAVRTLLELQKSTTPAGVRLGAAKAVLAWSKRAMWQLTEKS